MHAQARVDIGAVIAAVAAAHPAPVGVEFLGQDHRQRGLHALAEFEPVDGDGHGAVGRDGHKRAGQLRGLEGGRCSRALRLRQQREHAQRKAAGGTELEEAAARQRGDGFGVGFGGLLTRQQLLQGARKFVCVVGDGVAEHGLVSFRPGCERRRPRRPGCGRRCHSGRRCRPWRRRCRRHWVVCPWAAI